MLDLLQSSEILDLLVQQFFGGDYNFRPLAANDQSTI